MVAPERLSRRLENLSDHQRAELMRQLMKHRQDETATIPRQPRTGPLPLSFSQQRLWFLQSLEPESSAYNIPAALRLEGRLDVEALRRTLETIVRRHDILHTTFPDTDGQPQQCIQAPPDWALPVTDLTAFSAVQREAELWRLAAQQARRPFNLECDRLLRTALLRLAPQDHVLLLTIHHIVADGWALDVMVKEMAELYPAFCAGTPITLPELPIQYADFALWQRTALTDKALDKSLRYWHEQLRGVAALELPRDYPRRPGNSAPGARIKFQLPSTLSDDLQALSRRQDVTLFMLLLAAFQILLQRYTEQDDICVGTPVANRQHAELEHLIGCFANTLALRSDLSGNPGFDVFLQRVKQTVLAAYSHQDVPFERLLTDLPEGRHSGLPPLFQTMLTMQNAPVETVPLAGLRATVLPLDNGRAKFDLSLEMTVTAAGLVGSLEYNSALFCVDTIGRMAQHWQRLLQSVVTDPKQPIQTFNLLSDADREQLLTSLPEAPPPAYQPVQHWFEQQAASTPDAIALILDGHHLSYQELNRRANRLAWRLCAMGVGPEVVVGLCLERSLDLIEGLLGILKAGGTYLPLDPNHPGQRLALMLEDSQAAVVLTQQRLLPTLALAGPQVVCLDTPSPEAAPEENPNVDVAAENLAYIIYTSGSTGTPRAVQVSHRTLSQHCLAVRDHYQLTAADRVLQFAPLSFDPSLEQILPTLITGASLVLRGPELWDSDQFSRLIGDNRLTIANLPPAYWRRWLHDRDLSTSPLPLDQLRLVIVGGDALWSRDLEPWPSSASARLLNAYGPTETTVTALSYETGGLDAGDAAPERVPIGTPLPWRRAYILDKSAAHPVPVGVVGELYLGGAGLARGYRNHSALTAERFVPDPFSLELGARLYRTGDLARYRFDGNIEFLDRRDLQVKLRGFRVELGEIETALVQHSSVREAAVHVRREAGGCEQSLLAFVVPRDGEPMVTSAALRQFLSDKLPDYMLPTAFAMTPALPLQPSGKIDRSALETLDVTPIETERSATSPRTPTEALIADIWRDVLATEQVGVHDNFFGLGGHSLLIAQIAVRLRTVFAIELPLRALFDAPTVAQLSERVEMARRAQRDLTLPPPLTSVSHEVEPPLSYAQQRLWFLHQLQDQSAVYNIPAALRLRGPLDTDALTRSLQHIIRRHEILRTHFVVRDGEPRQHIAVHIDLPMVIEDLQHLAGDAQSAAIHERASAEAQYCFDLENGPLLRIYLLRLSPEEHVLFATFHHIIADDWAMGVFVRELSALYQAFTTPGDDHAQLPELAVQYADFARWQRNWLQGDILERQLVYWRQQLSGATTLLQLPGGRQRSPELSYRGQTHAFHFGPELSREIKALGQGARTTLFMTLLGAFAVLLSRYSGRQEVIIGSPVANRAHAQLEPLIGFFVNTLAFRIDLTGDPSVAELLHRVREVCLEGYTHQDVPFEQLLEALQLERDLSYSPLFQVMLVVHETTTPLPELPGLTVEPLASMNFTAKFDLTLALENTDQGLAGTLEYNSDLYDAAFIVRLVNHFRQVLTAMTTRLDQRISQLTLLDDDEYRRQVLAWNATDAVFPLERGIHHLIEAQAARTPDAVAVVDGEEQLDYRTLNARANQLAHYLRELGVGPQITAGISIERSLDLVIGLLGILKAGGAYVPLDPNYPTQHLGMLLQDASIPVLLTHARWLSSLPPSGTRTICLDREWETIAQRPGHNPAPLASANTLAYVIYTSGSTGRPKGAGVSHRSFSNLLHWFAAEFALGGADKVALITSLSFDLTQKNIYTPLLLGGTLYLAPDDVYDPRRIVNLISAHGITWINCTPSSFYPVLESAAEDAFSRLASLRYVVLGGEPIAMEALYDWFNSAQRRGQIVNSYGPTECADVCAACIVDPSRHADGIPIGKPIANVQLYVLDVNQQPVPMGVEGELCIGGVGVGMGYVNDVKLTADKFTPNPFSNTPGARLYRTGDLVRYWPDGNIEWLARIDTQIKVRGFRIEPGAIEAVLLQHDAVHRAVIVVHPDHPQQLVAYVVPTPGQHLHSRDLRLFLREQLPDYLVPARFVMLDQLPLSPNGKVDRAKLPAPSEHAHAAEAHHTLPQSEAEHRVAVVWEEVLGLEQVGIYDNFFDLGGHSLLMPRVCTLLCSAFQQEVPLVALFRYPTISSLARYLSRSQASPISRGQRAASARRRQAPDSQRQARRRHRAQR